MKNSIIGKEVNLYGKESLTILDFGDRIDLYRKFNMTVPANPMGYSIEAGIYLAVSNDNDDIKILGPGAYKKTLSILTENNISNLTKVEDVSTLKVGDVVYFKVALNHFIKGKVIDDFGNGKFFHFEKPIKLDADYSDTNFEIFKDEDPELEKKLYKM